LLNLVGNLNKNYEQSNKRNNHTNETRNQVSRTKLNNELEGWGQGEMLRRVNCRAAPPRSRPEIKNGRSSAIDGTPESSDAGQSKRSSWYWAKKTYARTTIL